MEISLAMISLLCTLFSLVNIIKNLRNKNRNQTLPPGPRPWPIVGSLPQMWRNKPAYKWLHGLLEEYKTDIACVRLGNIHVIPVKSPEIAREFLKKNDVAFASRPVTMATKILSSGFLTTGFVPWGDQWKKMRKVLVGEVFSHARLQWLLRNRTEEADNLVKFVYYQCKSGPSGSVVNVRTAALLYSSTVVTKMFFGTRYFGKAREDDGPGVEDQGHVRAVFDLLLHLYAFCVSDFLPWMEVFDVDGHKNKVKALVMIIRGNQDPIINERIRQWRDGTRTEPQDLLDVFISLKDGSGKPLLSEEEIKAQITELQLATMDNPFNTTEWVIAEMLNRPEMLRKATKELDRVVGKERLVQESDLPTLPYVRACAREALRLHPAAPFNLPHVSNADAVVAGYLIPTGSIVLLSRLGLGRNPKVWEDPLRFDPERHLNGDDANQQVDLEEHDLRFISFATGRRGCLGGVLGTTMTVMLLARLLQGFDWSMPPGVDEIDLTEAVSLFKSDPLCAVAKPRLPAAVYPV